MHADRITNLVQVMTTFIACSRVGQHPASRPAPDDDVTVERIEEFNQAIESRADSFDVPVVDLFAGDVEDDLISDIDGFHPNDGGHRQIADKFLEVILPELD
jgi:lysophospholipase L1-like esterase